MPTFRVLLEYDGSEFHGWQIQPEVRTVQGEIERALALILRGPLRTVAAGRTDRGVHARGQVVSFVHDREIDSPRVAAGIEGICGSEIRVLRLEEAPAGFHARHSAIWRRYAYRVLLRDSSLERARAFHPPMPVSLARLRETARPLLGEHDMSGFANQGDDNARRVCRVERADWEIAGGGLVFVVRADHFLYKMVRTLVATLLREAAPGGGGAGAVAEILASRDRRRAASPAPACGLYLERVGYDPPWPPLGPDAIGAEA